MARCSFNMYKSYWFAQKQHLSKSSTNMVHWLIFALPVFPICRWKSFHTNYFSRCKNFGCPGQSSMWNVFGTLMTFPVRILVVQSEFYVKSVWCLNDLPRLPPPLIFLLRHLLKLHWVEFGSFAQSNFQSRVRNPLGIIPGFAWWVWIPLRHNVNWMPLNFN